MTLFITFAPLYQYILAWVTLHFPVLHHCISSVPCWKPNNHIAQGPKNDYTHTYSHPLQTFTTPIAFLEHVSFFIIPFPIFHSQPIASITLAANYMKFHLNMFLRPKHSIKNSRHSTFSKIKPSSYLFKASIALDWYASILVFGWSVVSYRHSNSQQLCAPIFHSCGTAPWTSLMRYPTPLENIHLYLTI